MVSPAEIRDIKRAARGHRRAQSRLVEAHLPRVYALAYRMVGEASAAEDMTQEAFLRMWRALETWEARAKLSTWLYKVTYNLCLDHLRKRREVTMAILPDRAEEAPGPDMKLNARQEADILNAAIAKLPERQRAAISLCALGGASLKEAALILETSVEAVESLLGRAKRTLRTDLARTVEKATL